MTKNKKTEFVTDLEKELAFTLWNNLFGKHVFKAIDVYGRVITKAQFRDVDSPNGWVLSYVWPIEMGGSHDINNAIILNVISEKLTNGKLEGKLYGSTWLNNFESKAEYQFKTIKIDKDRKGEIVGRLMISYKNYEKSWSFSEFEYAYNNTSDHLKWQQILISGNKKTYIFNKGTGIAKILNKRK